MDKKTIFLSQLLMTFMMALSMSGIMAWVSLGPAVFTVKIWLGQFIVAWPIAFVLTSVAWPASMALTRQVLRSADRQP